MGSTPILWGRGSSTNVQKVLFTCAELGVAVDHRPLAGTYGGNDDAWFLALNPNGTVPVWQDGNFALYESQAIMRYLARQHGGLYGRDAQDAAQVDCWLDWFALIFWPPVRMLFLNVWRDREIALDAPAAQDALSAIARNLALLDTRLQHAVCVAGPDFSLADIAMSIGVNRLVGLGFDVTLPAAVAAWQAAQKTRPGFTLATADEPTAPNTPHARAG